MTPKEKAEHLLEQFAQIMPNENWRDRAIQSFLIAVDEIIAAAPSYPSDVDWDDVGATHQYFYEAQREEAEAFWLEVKEEINKL